MRIIDYDGERNQFSIMVTVMVRIVVHVTVMMVTLVIVLLGDGGSVL